MVSPTPNFIKKQKIKDSDFIQMLFSLWNESVFAHT